MLKEEDVLLITVCKNCVMDDTDPNIVLDHEGVCDYCHNFKSLSSTWNFGKGKRRDLLALSAEIEQPDSEFDCIIGLSGGLDSSYLAHVAVKEMGLRPLLLHVDAGWNTDQAVHNIESLVDGLGLELYTHVVNWEAVKELQVAFFRSGIPDQDLVQDAAFFSGLYKFARENNIKHILTGSNYCTEVCREPEEWGGYLGIDKTLFFDIWAKHGSGPFPDFDLIDILKYKILYQRFLGMRVHYPLNLTEYTKESAEKTLLDNYGWKPFLHKHHESRFTRFYEDYWLPRKFGYDKRKAHFSSLILTNQMCREEAVLRLENPEMSESFLINEFKYVAHKLDLEVPELESIFQSPNKTFKSYRNKRTLIRLGARILKKFGSEKRNFR